MVDQSVNNFSWFLWFDAIYKFLFDCSGWSDILVGWRRVGAVEWSKKFWANRNNFYRGNFHNTPSSAYCTFFCPTWWSYDENGEPMRPRGHKPCGVSSSRIHSGCPLAIVMVSEVHVLRGNSVCTNSSWKRFHTWFESCWVDFYCFVIVDSGVDSLGGMLVNIRSERKWLGVRASISIAIEESVLFGLAFMNCSNSHSTVLKLSHSQNLATSDSIHCVFQASDEAFARTFNKLLNNCGADGFACGALFQLPKILSRYRNKV